MMASFQFLGLLFQQSLFSDLVWGNAVNASYHFHTPPYLICFFLYHCEDLFFHVITIQYFCLKVSNTDLVNHSRS